MIHLDMINLLEWLDADQHILIKPDGDERTHEALAQEWAETRNRASADNETPETPGGPWTSHGHDIPGVTIAGSGKPPVARCGGPGICKVCARDTARARSATRTRKDVIMDQAKAEAEKRWPPKGSPRMLSDWLHTGMASGFVLGAQWATEEDHTNQEKEMK